jgi:glutamate dehydrogenase
VETLLSRVAEDDPSAPFLAFAGVYLRRVAPDYLVRVPADDVVGHLGDLYDFIKVRPADEAAVRVFTPTMAVNGYSHDTSVVEISSPDMSFLVDSVSNELTSVGYGIDRLFHPVFGTRRDSAGVLQEVMSARSAATRESVQHIELDVALDAEQAAEVEQGVQRTLRDVRRSVEDFERMQGAIYRMVKVAKKGYAAYEREEVDEAVGFLEWLLDDNFVFLGYREYQLQGEGDTRSVSVVEGSGLGILMAGDDSRFAAPTPLSGLSERRRKRWEAGELIVITKTNTPSRVHRRAKMDYVGVRNVDHDGSIIGEVRLIGLFTSKAYMAPAEGIPILRRRLGQILATEDTMPGSHRYKEIVQIFNSFPKDELFATPTEDIGRSIATLTQTQERERVRLIVRQDVLQRNISLLVAVPRDRFNADLRIALQEYFLESYQGKSIDYRLSLDEADTARIHFTVWMGSEAMTPVPFEELEAHVLHLARTWEEDLEDQLVASFGDEAGRQLASQWAQRFPDYYKTATGLNIAVGDVARLAELADAEGPVVGLQDELSNGETLTRLSVYQSGERLELSAIMPSLEAFGIRVIEEVPTRLSGEPDTFIHDFGILGADGQPLDLEECGERVATTVAAVLAGNTESDSLSRLIISAGLDYRQVHMLRAYRTYWQRVGSGFTTEYINDAFAAHPSIAKSLIELFEARFDPDHADWHVEAELLEQLQDALDEVASLDEDRILRGFLRLILATLRTNAYIGSRPSLAFKFDSGQVPNMPEPAPFREIFVFAPGVEGVHLRGGRVARGGIRWSVRREDYRTEVLGLMKAQMTKNAVIVPNGSKGGFVLRNPAAGGPTPDEIRAGYVTFIRSLLDVTDNLVEGAVVHPDRVRIHDDDDPYLVVAADRGTATFSDTANAIAAEYGFWLGDAFASGGSAGYDHKVLGITARGAWESVKWHFRELGINPAIDPFTVVGIGDMSGDVFGNGLLRSKSARLVAAFDHRHIFIDPSPDALVSYEERRRLYDLPRSSWADYDPEKISAGGGVWPRTAKQIELSEEARSALEVDQHSFTSAELIQAILRSPVDLLWNGGIGSYVKATAEPNEAVGDRSNDAVRVSASELRTKVVAEGGNLGFTQRGRIEYALAGGHMYTDFIDNSGGVNCSDREVNLKILLGLAEERGEIDRTERDTLVASVAGDVVQRILYDNFLQAQILAQENELSARRLEACEDLMQSLESEGLLNRSIELLPTSEDMNERARSGAGLTYPELSVLLAYAKWSLRTWLMQSELPEDPAFAVELREYFPEPVLARFGHLVDDHPLRRELVAMLVANEVVNAEGITFVSRLMAETGASAGQVVRAYYIARAVTDAKENWAEVEGLVGTIPVQIERDLLMGIDELVEEVARWQLTNTPLGTMSEIISATRPEFQKLAKSMAAISPAERRATRKEDQEQLTAFGVPDEVAQRHLYQGDLVHACNIIEVAGRSGRPVEDVAKIFLLAGPSFELDWLELQVERLPAASRWHRQAVQAVNEELVALRRRLAEGILAEAGDRSPEDAVDHYLAGRSHALGRLVRFVQALAVDGIDDVASVVVAIRQIRGLAT